MVAVGAAHEFTSGARCAQGSGGGLAMNAVTLLALASLGLLVGPICHSLIGRVRSVGAFIDGFALSLVGGLCVFWVLPHAVEELGIVALALATLGASLPAISQRLWRGRSWSLGVVAVGLAVHAVLDGAVLGTQAPDAALALAVVTHRLPVGFAIVVATQSLTKSSTASWALASAMIVLTMAGFFAGPAAALWLPVDVPAALEALVAGLLLHVVFVSHPAKDGEHTAHAHGAGSSGCGHDHSHHQHSHHSHSDSPGDAHAGCGHAHHEHEHDHPHGHAHGSNGSKDAAFARSLEAAGLLSGTAVLFATATFMAPEALDGHILAFLRTLGTLVLESAPALLFGYALAGVLPFLLTLTTTQSLARGGRVAQSLRGVVFGLPLPVCSCGVLPLYESLIRRGAPPVAAMAFFVATPELGLDAVLLSVPLLGPHLALARVVAAFLVAMLVALVVGGRSSTSGPPPSDEFSKGHELKTWSARIGAGLRFGFVEVFDHTMPWIALGLIVAALAEPMLSHEAVKSIPPVLQVPVAALVGVPIYVCASGATPVAALALHKGLSAGAAIAFLIAGPATNITTFGVLARLHGRRTALVFGASVTCLAILSGWVVDIVGVSAMPVLDAHTETEGTWFAWLCVGCLVSLTIVSLFRQGPRGVLRQIVEPIHAS